MNCDIHISWRFVIPDRLALMSFELQPLTLMKGEEVTILFNAKVACVLSDCSTMAAGRQNFDFQLYLDTDSRRDGEPELMMRGGFGVTDGGLGLGSDLRLVRNAK